MRGFSKATHQGFLQFFPLTFGVLPLTLLVRGYQTQSDSHNLLLPSLTCSLMLQLPSNKQDNHQQGNQKHSRDAIEDQGYKKAPGNKNRPHEQETLFWAVDTCQLQAGSYPCQPRPLLLPGTPPTPELSQRWCRKGGD